MPRLSLESLALLFLGQSFQLPLDAVEARLELTGGKASEMRARSQAWIAPPPVQSDLFRFVDGANEEPHLDREQLDVCEIDLDVTGDNQPLVENPIEDVDKAVGA
jgi:hypothetical protein